jgi:sigma-E factor negative regulatory protein RseC
MIEQQARVVEIKEGKLLLQVQRQSACGSCSASKGCGTSVLSNIVGQKFSRLQADNNINASVGDMVVVALPEKALVRASVVMYIIPVFGMFVFALLADYFLDATEGHDLLIALSAIAGLLSGSIISRGYFSRRSSSEQFSPVVIRKVISVC